LVEKYPKQILLIYGILYQPTMDHVLTSEECTILGHNTAVVEGQEIDLIHAVELRIKRFAYQVASKDWNRVERGYSIAYLAKIAHFVPFAIRAERASRKWTGQAHSFFIWNFINSHVYLEDLKSKFTTTEVMYLYKNIERLKHASGSNDVQTEIFDKFITPRAIKGYNLNIKREVGSTKDTGIQKIDYTDVGINTNTIRPVVVGPVVAKHLARSVKTLEDYEDIIDTKMSVSYDTSGTREITLVDDSATTPAVRLTKSTVELSFQLLPINTSVHTVINHIDNVTYNVTYHEACILYLRLAQKRTGEPTVNIPNYCTGAVPKSVIPNAQYLSDTYMLPLSVCETLVRFMPIIPVEVNDHTLHTLYKQKFERWKVWIPNFLRGYTSRLNSHIIDRIYGEFVEYLTIDLVNGDTNYQDWLAARGISLASLVDRDIYIMEAAILRDVFHIDLDNGDTSTVTTLAKLLDRFTAYYVNVDAEVSGNLTLPGGHLGVLCKTTHATTPRGPWTDLTTGVKVIVQPLPPAFKSMDSYTTQGKRSSKAKLTIPVVERLTLNPLRIKRPMTNSSLLEN
jgi:hypothetical protein